MSSDISSDSSSDRAPAEPSAKPQTLEERSDSLMLKMEQLGQDEMLRRAVARKPS